MRSSPWLAFVLAHSHVVHAAASLVCLRHANHHAGTFVARQTSALARARLHRGPGFGCGALRCCTREAARAIGGGVTPRVSFRSHAMPRATARSGRGRASERGGWGLRRARAVAEESGEVAEWRGGKVGGNAGDVGVLRVREKKFFVTVCARILGPRCARGEGERGEGSNGQRVKESKCSTGVGQMQCGGMAWVKVAAKLVGGGWGVGGRGGWGPTSRARGRGM